MFTSAIVAENRSVIAKIAAAKLLGTQVIFHVIATYGVSLNNNFDGSFTIEFKIYCDGEEFITLDKWVIIDKVQRICLVLPDKTIEIYGHVISFEPEMFIEGEIPSASVSVNMLQGF